MTFSLSTDDLEMVGRVRDSWMATGLSTDRCDRAAAEEAVAAVYASVGRGRPRMVWMSSPLGGLFAAGVLEPFGSELSNELWSELRNELWIELRSELGRELRKQLRGQLRNQLGSQLRIQLWNQLGSQLRNQLRNQLDFDISLWGDAYWMAFYTCALTIAKIPRSPKLDALSAATKQLGWWWPFEDVAILTDRPTLIRRDDQARLHSDAGPALAYSDGYQLFSWHGVTVPEWVITEPTLEKALAESNTEIRRAAFESLGWANAIQQIGVKPIDECDDPGNPGKTLKLYVLPQDYNPYFEPVNLLVMTNGSPDRDGSERIYGETVPANITSALSAAAWQYGVDPTVYQQIQRRT